MIGIESFFEEKPEKNPVTGINSHWEFTEILLLFCVSVIEADHGESGNWCHVQGVCIGERSEKFFIDAENRSLNDTFLLMGRLSGVLQGIVFEGRKGTGGESSNSGRLRRPLTLML